MCTDKSFIINTAISKKMGPFWFKADYAKHIVTPKIHTNRDFSILTGISTDQINCTCRQPDSSKYTVWRGSQQDRCTSTPLTTRVAVSHVLPQTAQEGNCSAQTGVTVIISLVCVCDTQQPRYPPFSLLLQLYPHHSQPHVSASSLTVTHLDPPHSSHYCLHDFHIWANTHS